MPRLPITLATYGYDHVRDLVDGRVSVEGLEVTGLVLQFEDIVHRMELFGEFDVAEFSTGKYVSMLSRGDDRFVGLPVFPSRVPRLSAWHRACYRPANTHRGAASCTTWIGPTWR